MALTDVKSEQIQSSVALAGSPTTTTQSASDNSTKIATTAYVETAVANLVASAPAALNTLDELAAALNDDASFSTTVTNSIATKLPLAGGTMTGALNMGSQNITNAGTLNGITTTQSVSGNRWGVLPEVASNGVLEIGRYLDFHTTDGDTSDYGARFDYDGSKMILTSAFETQSTIKSSANISIEAAAGNPQLLVKTAGAGNNPNIRIQADSNYWDIQTLFSNADDELDFRYNGSSKLIIDKDGNVLIGATTSSLPSSGTPGLEVAGSGFAGMAAISRFDNNAYGPSLFLVKSRAANASSHTIVADDDNLGAINWTPDDGTNRDTYAASIAAKVDGTPGANDMPTRLEFMTTADGAASPTTRMTILNGGNVGIGEPAPDRTFHAKSGANSNDGVIRIESANNNIMDMGTDGTGHFINCVNTDPFRVKFAGTEKFRIENSGDVSLTNNLNLTGGGTIEAPSVGGGENLQLKAAGSVDVIIDSNSNGGDGENFTVYKHSNTKLMQVSEAGHVTVPSQPGFRARGSRAAWISGATTSWHTLTSANTGNANGSYPIGLTIGGDNHVNGYNIGSCFNVSNGTFTAPIEGKYQVYGSVYCGKNATSATSYMHFLVYVNSQQVNEIYTIGGNNHSFAHDFSLNFSTVLFLEVNDYVTWAVYTYDANVHIYGNHCSIGAHLLS